MATGIKKTLRANIIPLIAIMTAVTTVLTMFVKIPTPTRGYLNLSDTMIFFSAYAFGPWVGGIVGGLGPALSDLISGYPQWAIFTFVIDGHSTSSPVPWWPECGRCSATSSQGASCPASVRRLGRFWETPSRWWLA